MACGCVPDVRGLLDQALDDKADLLRRVAELADHLGVAETADQAPDAAEVAAAMAAGRLDRVPEPRAGALAVYLDEDRAVAHVGAVGADGLITSRWRQDLVCRHRLFDLPRRFGEMVHWYVRVR